MHSDSSQIAFSVNEACKQLGGIGRVKLYQLLQSGELQSFKIGSRRMIARVQLEQFLQAKLEEAQS